jgi:hypothetical protein
MVKLSETERIEILIMVVYGDRQRSYQDFCHLFNNVHPERHPQSLNWLENVNHATCFG